MVWLSSTARRLALRRAALQGLQLGLAGAERLDRKGSERDDLRQVRLALAGVLSAVAVSVGASLDDEATRAECRWIDISPPSLGEGGFIADVRFRAPDSAWAVGGDGVFPARGQALLLRWNGSSWRRFRGTAPGGQLQAIAGTSEDDVWAVGWSDVGTTLAMRWGGRRLRVTPTPNDPRSRNERLVDVVALSRDNAWAVGHTYDADTEKTTPIALHWNGRRWRSVARPVRLGQLSAIDAAESRAVVAVGSVLVAPFRSRALLVRRIGGEWVRASLPRGRFAFSSLHGIAAAPDRAWAIGQTYVLRGNGTSTAANYVVRWDGSRWLRAAIPTKFRTARFDLITEGAGNAVWVASDATLVRWDGRRWTEQPLPHTGEPDARIIAISRGPQGLPAIVASYTASGHEKTVIGRITGC